MKLHKLLYLLPIVSFSCFAETYIGIAGGGSNQITQIDTNDSTLGDFHPYSSRWSATGRVDTGYNFNKYNAIEAGYNYYGKVTNELPLGDSITGGGSAVDLSYKLMLPTKIQDFSVFGRVGIAYDMANSGLFISNCHCGTISTNGYGWTDVLGAGVKYQAARHISVSGEWLSNGLLSPINLQHNNTQIGSWSTQSFLAGIAYNF